ncbi:MAG: methyltransferase domain-containing protein [Eubacteriales bacterium]|nr:methyltransferase domain-containing protein [Eubacteriales bacterium]
MDRERIKNEVKIFYKKLVDGEYQTEIDPLELYHSLGYRSEELAKLPAEIKLGLACGNPLEQLILRPGETLLDLGSGAGLDLFLARIRFPEGGTFYGVDHLPEMLAKAERTAAKKGFKDLEFRLGELVDLPFATESIDKIISNCVINLESDKISVYREIYRVLKTGGEAIISDVYLKQPLSSELQQADNLYGT